MIQALPLSSRRVGVVTRVTSVVGRLPLQTTRSYASPTDEDTNDDTGPSAQSSHDASAMAQSRAPFAMPKHSVDDSVAVTTNINNNNNKSSNEPALAWTSLGLWTELVDCLIHKMELQTPTPVQSMVIPPLLTLSSDKDHRSWKNLAFLAATGSGKTLAYCLPLLQLLKQAEVFPEQQPTTTAQSSTSGNNDFSLADDPWKATVQRPRLLILAPTRELVVQILSVVKQLCHGIKLRSVGLYGGMDYGTQRKKLQNQHVDVVVATPGRLLQHWKDQNIFLGKVEYVVLDEMDTLVEQGFAKDLATILHPLLYHKRSAKTVDPVRDLDPQAPHIVLTSATMTQAIQKMIGDVSNGRQGNDLVNAKKHYRKIRPEDGIDASNPQTLPLLLPHNFQVLKAPGLHKAVPRLQQVFVDVGGTDKMSLLIDILSSGGSGAAIARSALGGMTDDDSDNSSLTMVFCNTAQSCRAVQFALAEAGIETLAYHGELNSNARSENLQKFRRAGDDETNDPRVLVCTDLAARGLDVPQVDHVVMFDFPLNALDYLHRSGRTARGVGVGKNERIRKGNGRVTALVSKRDKVLANAIESAVQRGDPLDGLSSRKSDYLPGGRLNQNSRQGTSRGNRNSPRGGRKLSLKRGGSSSQKGKVSTSSRRRRS